MCQQRLLSWVLTVLAVSVGACVQSDTRADPPPLPSQEQPEILTRGPVHEGFAQPVNLELQAGLLAPVAPPANIEEIPPADRPAGDQYVWVPGYWSWDAERNNYVWVSACWRAAPPGMSWVPGYWAAATGGFEWVAGFWTPLGTQEIEYLPVPPTAGNADPSGSPPSEDHVWVPPCEYWNQDHYIQRPGYWLEAKAGWVWVPSHYVRTPRGYVFCAGHWDYALKDRGMLFAPVCFSPSVYGRADVTYSPSIVVDLESLADSLFTYPRYSHYYFGDYYDDSYLQQGIYPWFGGGRMGGGYDPIYQYDRWDHHRTEPRWAERQQQEYDVRRADKGQRPARTYHELETRIAQSGERGARQPLQMARPLARMVTGKASGLKFESLDAGSRQKIAAQGSEVHKFREQRSKLESPAPEVRPAKAPQASQARTDGPPAERKPVSTPPAAREAIPAAAREVHGPQAERVKMPASPVVSRPSGPGAEDKRPPAHPAEEHRAPPEVKDSRRDDGQGKPR